MPDYAPCRPPPSWAQDSLTQLLEMVRKNQFATFHHMPEIVGRLKKADQLLEAFITTRDPPNFIAALLLARGHSAFRAAAGLAMAGHCVEAFPLLRSTLESAGYAIRMTEQPELQEIWLRRHESDTAMSIVKREFSVGQVKQSVGRLAPDILPNFEALYERAIDFGGHPNERAVTGSLIVEEGQGERIYKPIYLHGEGPALQHSLRSVAQTGIWLLLACKHLRPDVGEQLELEAQLAELMRDL